jgi:transposase InsO family protein
VAEGLQFTLWGAGSKSVLRSPRRVNATTGRQDEETSAVDSYGHCPAARALVDGLYARHARGRPRFRTLNIVDDYTREYVAIEVDRSRPGLRVTRILDRLRAAVGLPQSIVLDKGPEFAGRTLEACAYAAGVTLCFIRPGNGLHKSCRSARLPRLVGSQAPDKSRYGGQITSSIQRCSREDIP